MNFYIVKLKDNCRETDNTSPENIKRIRHSEVSFFSKIIGLQLEQKQEIIQNFILLEKNIKNNLEQSQFPLPKNKSI